MAFQNSRLNLTHRTSSVPFPSHLRDRESVAAQSPSHLPLQTHEKPTRRESDPSAQPITRQTATKRKASVSRHAMYIPAGAPGPLAADCSPPPPRRHNASPSRCHTALSPSRPIISGVIAKPAPPLPRPSIRTYASSPSMTLRPQPPPFPYLNLHAKAAHSEQPPEQQNTRKTRRQCQYGYGYNPHLISGLHAQHPRPHAPREPVRRPAEHRAEESDSSNMGTPAAVYASESDSDSTSSFDRGYDQDLQCEFPKPPTSTSGGAWGGRGPRVESSPLFTEEETDAVKRFLRRRWGAGADRARDRVPHAVGGRQVREHWEEETDFSWEAESPKQAHVESVCDVGNRPAVDPLAKNDGASRGPRSLRTEGGDGARARRGFVQELGCDLPSSFPGQELQHGQGGAPVDAAIDHTSRREDFSSLDATLAPSRPRGLSSSHGPHAKPTQQLDKPPATHAARKTTSMQAVHTPDRIPAASVPAFRETLPLRIHPKSPSALDRLDASIVQLQAHRPPGTPGSSGARAKRGSDRPKPVPFPRDFVSLEKSGRGNPLLRSQTSLPPAAVRCVSEGVPLAGSSSAPASIDPGALTTPFLHRTTWSPSQPPVMRDKRVAKATRERGLKSFMDITPEQECLSSSSVHKERLRKLLARASSGVAGWGRSFTQKGSLAR